MCTACSCLAFQCSAEFTSWLLTGNMQWVYESLLSQPFLTSEVVLPRLLSNVDEGQQGSTQMFRYKHVKLQKVVIWCFGK